ncbi:unnamed protein product [Natator depressus]
MPLKWMLILNFILVLTSITIAIFFIRCRRQYFGHTWMRNIHWTNMKYICPVHPVKRGLCLVILFLILGICFLSAQAATGEISDHTDPLPHPTNANCNANEKLQDENEWRKARNETDDITLDAGTAHPNLSIAGDKKSLKHEAQPQQVSYNPERFDSTVCVLGSEGFSSGKHYWEVDVRSSTDWDLGVARKSIQRQGKLSLSPKEGFWVLSLSGKDYWAKTDPWTRVVAQKKLQKIGVYLSYKEGQVTFFNVTDMSLLFRFNDCSFSGAVYPFFKNSHKETAMKICSIKEEE